MAFRLPRSVAAKTGVAHIIYYSTKPHLKKMRVKEKREGERKGEREGGGEKK